MRTVSAASVAANPQGVEGLPESALRALGELAGAAKEGLLALSVGVGLGCYTSCCRPKSTRSSARRPATSPTAARSATGEHVAVVPAQTPHNFQGASDDTLRVVSVQPTVIQTDL